MPGDPTPGRIVLYRSRTGFITPAIIVVAAENLMAAGVERYRGTGGRYGVPPLSSMDHVHLVVFSAGLPEAPGVTCQRCGGPMGVGQAGAVAAGTEAEPGGVMHADPADCDAGGRMLMRDSNMGGTFREWDVPLWEPQMTTPNVPGALPTAAEQAKGTWAWPVIR
jgi:hypothetical protein